MNKKYFIFLVLLTASFLEAPLAKALPLRFIQSIPLPHVEGRIDHLAIDLQGQRLFVAALGNNTVEILDLKKGERLRTLTGFREPQGVLFIPELNRLFVTSGGDGTIKVFNATSFEVLKTLPSFEDADNIRYNPVEQYVYVGYGNGGIEVVRAADASPQGAIGLKGHPEAFELEKTGARIFVNLPSVEQIAILDRKKRSVVSLWSVKGAQANFPMSLDEAHHRLFVGFRRPSLLLILDTESGKEVARVTIHQDPDDIFYDSSHQNVYISCGEGFLDVLHQKDADHYEATQKIPTASGARTSLFVPEWQRFYLAVPHHGNQEAEIRVYDVKI